MPLFCLGGTIVAEGTEPRWPLHTQQRLFTKRHLNWHRIASFWRPKAIHVREWSDIKCRHTAARRQTTRKYTGHGAGSASRIAVEDDHARGKVAHVDGFGIEER